MNEGKLKKMLKDFKAGKISSEEIIERLKKLPYEDIDFAKIDHHRFLRQGLPEVIFAEGKTTSQVVKIFTKMREFSDSILITRANRNIFEKLTEFEKDVVFNEDAKCIGYGKFTETNSIGKIVIVTAGTSDIFVAEEAKFTASFFGNRVETVYDVGVAGLHRLLLNLDKIKDAEVVIAIAGMEGALPSVIAGLVNCIVIAVPTSVGYGTSFNGLTPLFGMLNSCSPNVLVVNINNGFGAAYCATLINRKSGNFKSKNV